MKIESHVADLRTLFSILFDPLNLIAYIIVLSPNLNCKYGNAKTPKVISIGKGPPGIKDQESVVGLFWILKL